MNSVAGALHHTPVMHGDSGIDQIAAERPQPRQRANLVRAGKPAVSDDIGAENCGELSNSAMTHLPPRPRLAQKNLSEPARL